MSRMCPTQAPGFSSQPGGIGEASTTSHSFFLGASLSLSAKLISSAKTKRHTSVAEKDPSGQATKPLSSSPTVSARLQRPLRRSR